MGAASTRCLQSASQRTGCLIASGPGLRYAPPLVSVLRDT